ncbi:Uncharacterised protein [Candidatus Burarchaeum australiense]|nr:Uncharacterised protein [Candidatus Burarchaeum australiense]
MPLAMKTPYVVPPPAIPTKLPVLVKFTVIPFASTNMPVWPAAQVIAESIV